MGDVWVATRSIQVAEQGPGSPSMAQGTEKAKSFQEEIVRQNSLKRSSSARRQGTVTLASIPNELHLEILRQVDLLSICAMRLVNSHFQKLIDTNQETILHACMHNVECIGPHAILLDHVPSPGPYTLSHALGIHHTKTTIIKVAQLCTLTQNAKLEALYCIHKICKDSVEVYSTLPAIITDAQLEIHRHNLFSRYTTLQLQNMTHTSIRLVFKIAQLMGYQFNRSTLHIDVYTRYNSYLLANGPNLIVDLATREIDERHEYLDSLDWFGAVPRLHDEVIQCLGQRGSGLMTDPGIEIQQFFQEEDTILDMGVSVVS